MDAPAGIPIVARVWCRESCNTSNPDPKPRSVALVSKLGHQPSLAGVARWRRQMVDTWCYPTNILGAKKWRWWGHRHGGRGKKGGQIWGCNLDACRRCPLGDPPRRHVVAFSTPYDAPKRRKVSSPIAKRADRPPIGSLGGVRQGSCDMSQCKPLPLSLICAMISRRSGRILEEEWYGDNSPSRPSLQACCCQC